MSVLYDKKRKTYLCKYSYKDWTGERRWSTKRGFARRKDAVAFEVDIKRISKGQDYTIQALATLWEEDCKQRNLSDNSMRSRRGILKNHILPKLGHVKAADITPNTLRQWQNNLPDKLSYKTKTAIRLTMSALFNFGMKYYGLTNNPMVSVPMPTARKVKTAARPIWEPWEFDKFISILPPDREDFRLLFIVLFFSGMRIGEALALGMDDLDFGKNTISISKTYNYIKREITPPKTASSYRTISMPPQIMQMLQRFVDAYAEPPERVLGVAGTQATVGNWLRRYTKKAELPPICLHDLRHSHASLLIQRGIPITDISRRLGHKNAAVTMQVYSHFYKTGDAKIAENLAKIAEIGSLLGQSPSEKQ